MGIVYLCGWTKLFSFEFYQILEGEDIEEHQVIICFKTIGFKINIGNQEYLYSINMSFY